MNDKLTILERLDAKEKANKRLQEIVNQVDLTLKVQMIQIIAMSAHAEYPQYEGHWDKGWELVRINQQVLGKSGKYFETGDYALFNHETFTAYSVRIGVNTSVEYINFIEVE